MKAGTDISSGFVSRRTSKCNEGVRDPILKAGSLLWCSEIVGKGGRGFSEERKTKGFGKFCGFSRIYLLVGVAGIKSGL